MDAPAVDAIARLVPAVLKALYALEFAGRHLAPQTLPRLVQAMAERPNDLAPALAQSRAIDWPERLQPARDCLERAAEEVNQSLAALLSAAESELEHAIRFMVTGTGLVVEGAAAAGVAAVRAGRVTADGPIVVVVSGRNIARARLGGLLTAE